MSTPSPELGWRDKVLEDARTFVRTAIMNLELRMRESATKHVPLLEQQPDAFETFRRALLGASVQVLIAGNKDASLVHEEAVKALVGEAFKSARTQIARERLTGKQLTQGVRI